jgi:ATP-dependent helicase/nuclease subunit A
VLGNIGELARIPEEDGIFDPKVHAHMKEVNAFSYPYAAYAKLPAKATVTEIKKRSQMEETSEELPAEKLFAGEEEEAVPAFARESGQEMTGGAARGTVYHHFFECFDYSRMPDADDGAGLLAYVEAERSRMMNCALMSAADDRCIRAEDFVRFLQTPLGRRMKAAADAGCLRREQPFVIDVPAKDIDRSWPEDENILVQGTIDAYFSEGGGYVLVDYKTDRIRRRDADGRPDGRELAEKYHKQLEYYADALKQITGREVREMYIYSVQLGREIKL